MVKAPVTVMAILAAFVIGGCGGSPTTSSTGTPMQAPTSKPGGTPAVYNACELVTPAKATQVVGTDVVAVSGGGGAATASTCVYASTSTGASFSATIFQVPSNSGQAAVNQAMISRSGLTTLTGIGDAAGESKDDNSVTIAFAKGQALVVLAAASPSASGTTMAPKLESLARSIAGQI